METEIYRVEVAKGELQKSPRTANLWIPKAVDIGIVGDEVVSITPVAPSPEETASPVITWEFTGPDDLQVGQIMPIGKIHLEIAEIRDGQPRTIVLKLPETMLHASDSD
jgi:hypothetical protein